MVKDCPRHGHFEDVMSIDTEFYRHLEESFPGRDIPAHADERLHNHGSSTIRFSDWSDLVHGPDTDWGQVSCGCHPNCGVGIPIMVDKETKEAVPLPAFFNVSQLAKDVAQVNDAARGKLLSVLGMALAMARNYDPFRTPKHFTLLDLLKEFDKKLGATGRDYGKVGAGHTREDTERRRSERWNMLFVAGMWFQDLFNYDFRRTEMCIIPYATQEGEISFCAYNTGVGWRNIVEKMHMTATLTQWYEEHGRHEIFAGGKQVALPGIEHSLEIRPDLVAAEAQQDLVKLGIARNAREEKARARDAKLKQEMDDARMAALYRQHVLGEKPGEPLIQLQIRSRREAPERQAGDSTPA
jgi:uncharacterized radical SAM superfamily Fe-S cluster-containing enzyme